MNTMRVINEAVESSKSRSKKMCFLEFEKKKENVLIHFFNNLEKNSEDKSLEIPIEEFLQKINELKIDDLLASSKEIAFAVVEMKNSTGNMFQIVLNCPRGVSFFLDNTEFHFGCSDSDCKFSQGIFKLTKYCNTGKCPLWRLYEFCSYPSSPF